MRIPAPILVFVRPQAAGNIGALSRVMSNFACSDLRLVGQSPVYGLNPEDPFSKMDWALSTKRAEDLLKKAQWFKDLSSALEGTHFVLGSSGRKMEYEKGYARALIPMEEALKKALEFQNQAQKEDLQEDFQWALVLGPEDDGLNDHESALCHFLVHISTNVESPSLNIAMAAGIMIYHWHIFNLNLEKNNTPAPPQPKFSEKGRSEWATHNQKEDFLNYLLETLSKTQFLKYPDTEAVKARIRRWLQIAPIPLGELLFAFEIVYHLRSWGTGSFEKRDFLKNHLL